VSLGASRWPPQILIRYDESPSNASRERATGEKVDAFRAGGLCSFAYFNSSPNHPNILVVGGGAAKDRLGSFREELMSLGIPRAKILPLE
jgi:hypothetical protein